MNKKLQLPEGEHLLIRARHRLRDQYEYDGKGGGKNSQL